MIDTAALREKVLDLAIRGKLVPQDPNDEPASVLLERIRLQKQQMVKEGKLKAKDIKDDSVIFVGEDNLHYEKFADGTIECLEETLGYKLPSGWTFTTIGAICALQAGKFVSASAISPICLNDMYPCYGGNGIRGYVDHYSLDGDYPIIGRQGALCGNVNMAHGKFYATEHAVVVTPMPDINLNWLYHVLVGLNLNQYSAGAAQPGLAVCNILKVKLPLPPTNEQKRIAEAVDDALILIEKLNAAKNDFNSIITLIKSKILDLAIRGKLVPQDPNDEPASVLLERIRAEKEELIKQGKIKRDKKESVIFKGEDNSYYENLPSSWSVSTLGEITNNTILNDGDWILSENMDTNGTVKLIQLGSIGFMEYVNKGFKYITEETFSELSCTQILPSYLLINRIINDRMCACILPSIDGKLITTVDTCWIAPKDDQYDLKYLLLALSSPQFQSLVLKKATGVTRKRISKNNLIALPLPFPPLAEQKRIVSVVSDLFGILKDIEGSLN